MTTETPIVENDAIHGYFGLTYANYLVLHRTLMQSMPGDWQDRMVACLEELDSAFRHVKSAPGYKVDAAESVIVKELSASERNRAGVVTCEGDHDDEDGDHETCYYTADRGDELDPHQTVMVPLLTGDPVPHYNRGRTRVEPAGASS